MANRSSQAGHQPERTCVICRSKKMQNELLHFKLRDKQVVFDFYRRLSGRGYYVCDAEECLERIPKWIKKQLKKKK